MASGLPVVTTDIGARGIDNTNGKVYVLCDRSAESLTEQLRRLTESEELRAEIGSGGRKEAELKYSWEKISRSLGKTLYRLLDEKRNAREKVLMVTTYPPEKCGIGTYAVQQVNYMRRHGSAVDILAIKGNGKYQVTFDSAEKIRSLKQYKDKYDRIIIQYHASFFYEGADQQERIRRHRAFREVFSDNPNIEVVCHEISFPYTDSKKGKMSSGEKDEYRAKIEKWLAAPKVIFHTEKERELYCRQLGVQVEESRTEVVLHHRFFVRNRDISQQQAREELGIPQDDVVFLCIGFIQQHKAFDKAAEAMARLEHLKGKKLYIVGSVRYVAKETMDYLEHLKSFAGTNDTTVVAEFVSDEMFDTWIIASDCVVVPYSEIWSSSVLGRAKLFGKHCIVKNVGGLEEQLEKGDLIFGDYAQLPGQMEKAYRKVRKEKNGDRAGL